MKSVSRPWILEVWEIDRDTADLDWCLWSSTVSDTNALPILGRLLSKGHRARVRNSHTGEIVTDAAVPLTCPFCGDRHPGATDGSCLLA